MHPDAAWSEQDSVDFQLYASAFVPYRDVQQRILCDLLPGAGSEPLQVVDLCCGDGSLAAAVLRRYPAARVTGVDGSEAMLAAARQRTAEYTDRFVARHQRLEQYTFDAGPVDAIVSSLALHHLTHPAKRELFASARQALRPGGVLLIADLVLPVHAAGAALAAALWDEDVRRRSLHLYGDLRALDAFRRLEWNLYRLPEPDPEDRPAPLSQQLAWLEAAGFASADVFWMWAGHAIFGASVTYVLQLHEVRKAFGNTVALQRTNLTVQSGETTVLIGPSGCGKSTLLRLMNGLLLPDSGQVLFDSSPLRSGNLHEARRRIGYVIQDGGLFPHLTAAENITLMARHLGRGAGDTAQRLAELADLTHLSRQALERYPAELSGGQAQRVALMRALFLQPALLLLDEPMAALDPMIRAELQAELRDIFDRLRSTVVLVTHDLAEALHFADTMVLLRHGRVQQVGPPEQFVRAPATPFVRRFLAAQRPAVWPDGGDA